ncbi:MAG: hypothetical protein HYW14_02535, partial [Planctomycetes bacterium]|nr:hypothetical protein [Planctomycetota bacterium]
MKNALLVVFVILVVGVIHELPLHGQTGSPEGLASPPIILVNLSVPPKEEVSRKAFIIPLHGMIDGGLFSSLKRRTAPALNAGAELIIFDIDTYGGRLEPAFDISDHIAGIKDVKTVCYISKKAISAGALIAISCNEIIMAPE